MFKLKAEVHQQLLDIIELRRLDFNKTNDEDLRKQCDAIVKKILSDRRYDSLNDIDEQALIKDILDEALGLGPLEGFLADDDITEIMVNRPDRIYLEKKGKIRRSQKIFSNTKSVQRIISRIVGPLGRRIDESSPMVDARLADGSRVNVVIPPLALDGPCLTIRKFSKIPLTVEDMIRYKSISRSMVDFIQTCVVNRKNILIAGGTGSGKTTALNVFSSFIPEGERVVTIEDAAELQLPQDHVIRLESRPANIEGRGEITIRHLVKNALRMRPDRIIIGECRSGETLDMLQAMNTGHDGSITTIHANSPKDVVSRLETMVLQAGTDLSSRAIREQIASALDIVIQQMRFGCGARKITNISEVVGMEDDQIVLQDIFYFKQYGVDAEKKTTGTFLATGWIPEFYEALQDSGAQTDMSIFHN
ncbi:MAG: CpaF family protein [Desulfobacteraceae bacterium]|jgi:pilus assembly protein CpaF